MGKKCLPYNNPVSMVQSRCYNHGEHDLKQKGGTDGIG